MKKIIAKRCDILLFNLVKIKFNPAGNMGFLGWSCNMAVYRSIGLAEIFYRFGVIIYPVFIILYI